MKNLGLAGAIALCGIGLILIGLGNFRTQTVYAAPAVAAASAVQDKGEPTIIWMDQTMFSGANGGGNYDVNLYGSLAVLWRMWSDGTLEVRFISLRSARDIGLCQSEVVGSAQSCEGGVYPILNTDWIVVPEPPGGEGYACRSDVNGDRRVDGIDLATLLSQWGDGVSCDPQPSYDCLQLSNLNS